MSDQMMSLDHDHDDAVVEDRAGWDVRVEHVDINELTLDPKNARRGDVASIVESLREFGQHRPLVARKDGHVIVGNHMLKAARTLGWSKIAVIYVDDDEEKSIRRSIADNATGDRATWDDAILAQSLMEVGNVPGFSDRDFEKIIADYENSLNEEEKEEPTYPIVARLNEEYDYVIIVARNSTDVAWLHTRFQLQQMRSYKSQNIGKSHVLSVERAQEVMGS